MNLPIKCFTHKLTKDFFIVDMWNKIILIEIVCLSTLATLQCLFPVCSVWYLVCGISQTAMEEKPITFQYITYHAAEGL